LLARATVGSGLFSPRTVLAVARLAEPLLHPVFRIRPFLSEKPRLTLAKDLGRGNRLFLTDLAAWVREADPSEYRLFIVVSRNHGYH